ncbi:hypothetical protein ACLESO_37710 [Pyxidicoccus sp. 3LG]
MDTAEMTARIEKEETRIRELLNELDALVPSIVAAVSAEVVEWSQVAAKNAAEVYFTSRPKQHAEFGAKLPALKSAIDAMLARIPSLVERELERLGSWPHRATAKTPWTVMEETGSTWWEVARTTYGFIAQPLAEHGFHGHLWREDSNHPGFYTFIYGGEMKTMPESVRAALRPYRQRWAEVMQRREAVAALEKDRAKATFTTAWGK